MSSSGWRTIDTAPKDRFVLLFTPTDGDMNEFVAMAKWQGDGWYGVDDCGLTFNPLKAWDRTSHWMSLPAPPGQDTPDDAGVVEELVEAAEAVVARWETPLWKDAEPTAGFIYRLRAALSRAKTEDGE